MQKDANDIVELREDFAEEYLVFARMEKRAHKHKTQHNRHAADLQREKVKALWARFRACFAVDENVREVQGT